MTNDNPVDLTIGVLALSVAALAVAFVVYAVLGASQIEAAFAGIGSLVLLSLSAGAFDFLGRGLTSTNQED